MHDIERHVSSKRHVGVGKVGRRTPKISSFMGSEKPSLQQLDVIQAETLFMKFLVEHNIALSAADHAGQLFRHMFPGSRIAKEYFCARMKATEIMKCCANNIIL